MTRLAERIEALRAEHAPDPRLAVWEVEAVEGEGGARLAGKVSVEAAVEPLREAAEGAGATFDVRLLPDEGVGEEVAAAAHRSLAHVRREPRHASELVTQAILGEEALVLEASGEWLRARLGDGYVGWIHRGSLVRRRPEEGFAERLARRVPPPGTWVVTARSCVARLSPEPVAPPACDLVEGGRVKVEPPDPEAIDANALRVTLPDGATGWIPAGAAIPFDRLAERYSPGGRAILDHAAQSMGLPYLWGGTSEKGYDCSGIVQRIYALHGTLLPRDADQQKVATEPVEVGDRWEHARDGDLAFFTETPGRVTHVGIVARGGRVLHASTSRNGVAWDALGPTPADRSPFGERLAEMWIGTGRAL